MKQKQHVKGELGKKDCDKFLKCKKILKLFLFWLTGLFLFSPLTPPQVVLSMFKIFQIIPPKL